MRTTALLLFLFAPSLQEPAQPPEPQVHESEHYRIHAFPPFDQGEEYTRLAEVLYEQLKTYFKAEPELRKKDGEKLEVFFWSDREGFTTGAVARGVPKDSARDGGVYWPGTKSAYFYRQPTENFTRHLFLHELVHQFQFLAVLDNKSVNIPGWYLEGIAEYFAFHSWDGETLKTGLSDVVGLETNIPDMVGAARAGELDLVGIVDGTNEGKVDKPEFWALVYWLLETDDKSLRRKFKRFEKEANKHNQVSAKKLFGGKRDQRKKNKQGLEFLSGLRTTWKIEWLDWDARHETLVGRGNSLIRRFDPDVRGGIQAKIKSEGPAGLVFGFRSTDDFLAAYFGWNDKVFIKRRKGKYWVDLGWQNIDVGPEYSARVEISSEGRVTLTVDDEVALELDVDPELCDGHVGLFTEGSVAEFRECVGIPGGVREGR